MSVVMETGHITLHQGHALEVVRSLASDSIDCVVTSPPYWGLRDYGIEPSVWGGDVACLHEWVVESVRRELRTGLGLADSASSTRGGGHKAGAVGWQRFDRGTCARCAAWRGQYGLEPTPAMYVEHTVSIFREVRRVLASHGTLWLNIGDSYAPSGALSKNLIGIPWRVAFALQADGWYLRSEIIWAKPNPMPESVTDRPTKSHETVFLMSKSPRYYFDQEAVREPTVSLDPQSASYRPNSERIALEGREETLGAKHDMTARSYNPAGRNMRSVWTIATRPYPEAHFATFPEELPRRCILAGTPEQVCVICGRPRERIVETMRTFASGSGRAGNMPVGKHGAGLQGGGETLDIRRGPLTHITTTGLSDCGHAFGIEPDALEVIESPTGDDVQDAEQRYEERMVSGRRGMARERRDDTGRRPITRYEQRAYAAQLRERESDGALIAMMREQAGEAFAHYRRVDLAGARPIPPKLLEDWIERGWLVRVELPPRRPQAYRSGVVLDPFAGSGTTLAVAQGLGRRAVGIELSPEYVQLIEKRCAQGALAFE